LDVNWTHKLAMRLATLCTAAWISTLAACGGGGGTPVSPSSTLAGPLRVTASPTDLTVTHVQGNDQVSGYFVMVVDNAPADGYWTSASEVPVDGQPEVIVDGYDSPTERGPAYLVWFKPDLPPGTYDRTVRLEACIHENCDLPQRDASTSLNLRYIVLPNISAAIATMDLSRVGAEAAPAREVPLRIPPEAGALVVSVDTLAPHAFDVRLDGSTLKVNTTQARPGTYTATVTVHNPSDRRYHWSLPITYTVQAAPEGEIGLRVSASDLHFDTTRGSVATQTLTIQNPTWSSAAPAFTFTGDTSFYQVTPLGNNQYQVSFDARQAAGSQYRATMRVDVDTESTEVYLYGSVDTNFTYADGDGIAGFSIYLGNDTAAGDLVWQRTVGFKSRSADVRTWHAEVDVPWITLQRRSGSIGTDRLTFTLDQAALLGGTRPSLFGRIRITADGTPDALDIPIYYDNQISRLERVTSGPVMGTRGTIRIRGANIDAVSNAVDRRLQVLGARVVNHQMLTQWNLGNYSELVLDVDQAVPGQAITVRWDSPMFPSQVTVPVQAAPTVVSGALTLPFGMRRGIVVHPSTGDLYLADGNSVLRGHLVNGSWNWQHNTIAQLADVSVSADGSKVFALATDNVYGLNPTTLGVLSQSTWPATAQAIADLQTPAWRHILITPADGETYVALASKSNAAQGGEAWLRGDLSGDPLDISIQIGAAGLGLYARDDGFGARALVASATGRTTLITHPVGTVYAHQADQPGLSIWGNQPSMVAPNSPIPAGVNVAAAADVNNLFIRSDGVLQSLQSPLGPPLSNRLPPGWRAGGYGLSADGRLALVYGYRLDEGDPAHPVAAEAAVFVFDISQLPIQTVSQAPQAARLPLAPLGCTSTTLAPGEACVHDIAMTLAADGQGAYLVGPRGLAIVALGELPTASRTGRVKAASKRPATWQAKRQVGARP
jgi:hypothetical protein